MFVLWQRISSWHRDDVHKERWIHLVVLLKQMSQEFFFWKRSKKTQMDSVLWQGRKGQRLVTTYRPHKILHFSRAFVTLPVSLVAVGF